MDRLVRNGLTLLLLALFATPFSCQPKQEPKTTSGVEFEITDLKRRVAWLEGEVFEMRAAMDMFKNVSFDVTSLGAFQQLETENGWFLVSLKDAQPYLNGFRVTLSIGNPTSATYNGFKLKAKWGKALREGVTAEEWQKSMREKEFSFPGTLEVGTWNSVTVPLTPASADELGTLKFSMTTEVVSLRQH